MTQAELPAQGGSAASAAAWLTDTLRAMVPSSVTRVSYFSINVNSGGIADATGRLDSGA
jgi:hypothetical protein